MGAEEQAKAPEVEGTSEAVPVAETVKDVTEEKASITPPLAEEKADDSKPVEEKIEETPAEKVSGDSEDGDAALTRVETEKRLSLIKAWEENEKTKAENKAVKKVASIVSWEDAEIAAAEAELIKKEEELEKKKVEFAEKTKKKIAQIHKTAEAKKANAEAKRGEEILKVEETAGKYKAKGFTPKKLVGWLGI